MGFARRLALMLLLICLTGCGMEGDLAPSGKDLRPHPSPGTVGPYVGQNAPDFVLPDSLGGEVTLTSALAGKRGVVLYFTMWCPVCDTHMSHMRSEVAGDFPDVGFYAVDYVSGSVSGARAAQVESGYADSVFTVLADIGAISAADYDATMGTAVVVSASGVITLNEDYKDGSRLRAALLAL